VGTHFSFTMYLQGWISNSKEKYEYNEVISSIYIENCLCKIEITHIIFIHTMELVILYNETLVKVHYLKYYRDK
jgi:hypothetical protein